MPDQPKEEQARSDPSPKILIENHSVEPVAQEAEIKPLSPTETAEEKY